MNRTQMIKRAYVRGLAARGIYRARMLQKQAAGKDYAISGGIGAAGGTAIGSLIGALVSYAKKKNILRGAGIGGGIGLGTGLLGGLAYQGLKDYNKTIDGIPVNPGKATSWITRNYGHTGADAKNIARDMIDVLYSRGNEIMPPTLDPDVLKNQTAATRNAMTALAYPGQDDSLINQLALNATFGVPSNDTTDSYSDTDIANSEAALLKAQQDENSRSARENSKRVLRNNRTRKQEQEEREKIERIRNANGGGYR